MANATKQEAVDRVTAEEVMRRMDRGEAVVFVDTRNPEAWGQSNEKLPGAIRIPAGEVERRLNEIPKSGAGERWIVTYCT
jgi:rhodanese-related sulfurtransferase